MLQYTLADAVMIGRGALGNPWLPGQIHNFLNYGTQPAKILPETVLNILLQHLKDMVDYYGETMGVSISRKHICWYSKNFRDAKRFRELYTKIYDYATAVEAIRNFFSTQGYGVDL